MNFRAVVMILGFSVIGTELYNPVVRNFFIKTSFRNLPLAVELSVESLPDFIASIPDLKTVVKDPVSIFRSVLSHAEKRLAEIKDRKPFLQSVFIVNGAIGEGKTSFVKNLINEFRRKGIDCDGIVSERIVDNGITTGYDLVHISSGKRTRFLRLEGEYGNEMIGRFSICREGVNEGEMILKQLSGKQGHVIVIDEVGLLELEGRGWSVFVTGILSEKKNHLLMTVRTNLIDDVRLKWNPVNCKVFSVKENEYTDLSEKICRSIFAELE
jgi:nucleoside-triphosphatase THEP1